MKALRAANVRYWLPAQPVDDTGDEASPG